MDSITLGKKISKLRKDHKLTQAGLAEKLQVSNKTISKWETGSSVPDIVMIKKMSEIFGVPVESLIDSVAIKKKKISIRTCFIKFLKYVISNIIKIIFVIVFILLAIYFINNYNSIKVYNIKTDNDQVYITGSYFIESKEKNILIINNINIHNIDYEIITIKVRLYTLINGDKVYLGESDDLDGIVIEEISGHKGVNLKDIIKCIKKDLYLSIDIFDTNDTNHNYEVKFNVVKSFSNNKLAYFRNNKPIETNESTKSDDVLNELILLNNGFKKDEDNDTYIKNVDDLKIIVDLKMSKVTIFKETKKRSYIYYLELGNSNIRVRIFDKENKSLDNYQYNYDNHELICYQGNCDSYEKDTKFALSVLDSIKK